MKPSHVVMVLGLLVAAVAVTTVAMRTQESRRTVTVLPTEAEVRTALASSFDRAQHQGPRDYCMDSSSRPLCESQWDRAGGGAAIPRMPPRVTGVRTQDGYRILSLCGTNGVGDPYRSDFAVSGEGDALRPVEPVFWLNVRFLGAGADPVVAAAVPPETPPAPCS